MGRLRDCSGGIHVRFGAGKGLTAVGCAILGLLAAGSAAPQAPPRFSAPPLPYASLPSDSDGEYLRQALTGARAGDGDRVRTALGSIQDPLARKIAVWAMADGAADSMSFFELDAARRDLAGWPRALTRQMNAEKKLETAGMAPDRIITWFGGAEPTTAEGAMALAGALRAQGQRPAAEALIRRWWRTALFDVDPQRSMRARFGDMLSPEDNRVRADLLLYGPQGPAAQDMVDSLSGPDRDLAEARLALRSGRSDANARVAALTDAQRKDPGLIWEQALYFHKRGMTTLAWSLSGGFVAPPTQEVAARSWPDKRRMISAAMQQGDYRAAFNIARDCGMTTGADAAEAEFWAGWLALTRLGDPRAAELHFARLAQAGSSPITQGRALYWQGRAAEALGKSDEAMAFYRQGARHITVFYGQLAAEKAGITQIELGKDPEITAADRARFDGREVVQAARLLSALGLKDQFRVFVLHIDDVLPTAAESALLVDMARATGDLDLSMRVVRTAAQRGFILPERGYPVIPAPLVPGGAEPAFVLSITRQESNFDPRARSGADARGMMQLLPATGRSTARALGEPFTVDRLYDAEFNMRLGARYLGDMTNTFNGSYAMAAAGYNAGPGRPPQWIALCGDPRSAGTDPLNFIECIPFSETRNYVMRTMETMQVYRARLNGGVAPLRLGADLKRGGYSYSVVGPAAQ
ncbi:MAG: transglycosylase SLT domain-containing protein [Caulobacter sp.]|nr:transglycosylase SLT domain-containing protein [Caulobacter sp.]